MDTKFAKPTVSKPEVQTAAKAIKPAEMLYCIEHEAMVRAELAEGRLGHVHTEGDNLDFCYFPGGYAFCPPVIIDGSDWAAQDLSDDEKAQAELEEIREWLG